ncbi:MAG: glycosyltransferase family 2 protein [Bacteroidales bacterium]|nr:glycosyltransferase family 2 protein [Bacteroidales bacterium]
METIIQQIDYTVIVPVYNSENTLQALFDRTKAVFESLDKSFEMIFVEDGGKDNSWKVLTQIQKQNKNYVSAFRLNRNYGQHNATFCGMDHARGDYVITIDDDLQTPPEEIKKLIESAEAENSPDVVYGYYKKKQHSWIRNIGSRFLKYYTKTLFKAPGKGSSFRLFTHKINEQILSHRTTMVFIDELLLWYAGNISFIEVEHKTSEKAKSGYNLFKLIRMFMNVILYSTVTPLKIMVYGGIFSALVSFALGLYFIYRKMVHNVPLGYTSVIVTILFSTGILLFFMGIIGKYLSRIFVIQNKKPPYLIKRAFSRKPESKP